VYPNSLPDAAAEATDPAYPLWQLGRFTGVVDELEARAVKVPIRLLAASPFVLKFPQTYLNAVDPGRMLYGITFPDETPPLPLRPTLRAVPIIGGPSLEHTRIDLTQVPEAQVGDEVVIIGRQGDAEITAAEIAARHGLGVHNIAPTIGPRVTRVYVSGESEDGAS
jgi:alanine racemase